MITNIFEQLRRDEREMLYVYDDATGLPITRGSVVIGYPTIGIGRMVDKNKGGGLSKDEVAFLLENDVRSRWSQLSDELSWMGSLDDARHGVLLNMSFQLGVDGLIGFRQTLEFVRKGQYVAAAAAMLDSKWAKQTPERAERLAVQMRTGVWQ